MSGDLPLLLEAAGKDDDVVRQQVVGKHLSRMATAPAEFSEAVVSDEIGGLAKAVSESLAEAAMTGDLAAALMDIASHSPDEAEVPRLMEVEVAGLPSRIFAAEPKVEAAPPDDVLLGRCEVADSCGAGASPIKSGSKALATANHDVDNMASEEQDMRLLARQCLFAAAMDGRLDNVVADVTAGFAPASQVPVREQLAEEDGEDVRLLARSSLILAVEDGRLEAVLGNMLALVRGEPVCNSDSAA
eukprot:SRR837773.9756.p1 GENE.SRR837773.9756~~SRR837773.9756.p1  ORF type:complete len:265 (+),score=43.94 SRR837773.9756:61-795(+)